MSDLRWDNTKRQAADSDLAAERELEAALKNFRLSAHEWSEQEMSRTRGIHSVAKRQRRGWMAAMKSPIAAWSLGCVLAVSAVTMPLSVRHERQLAAQRQAAALQYRQQQAAEAVAKRKANSISDEELLSHVDSDIAQATPEALEPLASLMNDTNE